MGDLNRRDVFKASAVGAMVLAAGGAVASDVASSKSTASEAISEQVIDAYERVSLVIGEEINRAYTDILTRLASGSAFTNGKQSLKLSLSGKEIAADDLKDFFAVLGATGLSFDFQSTYPKPQKFKYFPELVPVNQEMFKSAKLGISGEISIGGMIRF